MDTSELSRLISELEARNQALGLRVALVERENRDLLRYKQMLCELAGSLAPLIEWKARDTLRSALQRFWRRVAVCAAPHGVARDRTAFACGSIGSCTCVPDPAPIPTCSGPITLAARPDCQRQH